MSKGDPKRLVHDHRSYLRAMQMSSVEVVVFVEGYLDRGFISMLLMKNEALKGIRYAVRASRELGTGAQGKSALLVFYQYLRDSGVLLSNLGGKRTVSLFILDKDALGYRAQKLECNHAEVTSHYAIENYIYRAGDLISATVSATGLDYDTVTNVIGAQWLSRAAQSWADWCAFCIFCNEFGLRVSGTFRLASQMHDDANVLDEAKKTALLAGASKTFEEKHQKSFDDAYAVAERIVAEHYQSNSWDRIFPGKWYGLLLERDVRRAGSSLGLLSGNLAEKITSCLVPTVNFQSGELTHIVEAAERVARLLTA